MAVRKILSKDEYQEKSTQAILRHWREAVPEDRMAHLVKNTTRGFARSLQMRLNRHAVSYGHWTFLRILWEKEGLTPSELSTEAGLMPPTTLSALRAMERLGYVFRRKEPDNRKKVFIFLTSKGRMLKDKLVPLVEDLNRIALEGASSAETATVRKILLLIIQNLADDELKLLKQKHRMPSTRDLVHVVSRPEAKRKRK